MRRFVVTGCPRSGTGYAASLFRELGVRDLGRVRFGSLELGDLAEGSSRRLRPAEIRRLWKDAER